MEHEPEPQLLRQANRKHGGRRYRDREFRQRMRFFSDRQDECYGQSLRSPNLLEDIRDAAPRVRFAIIVREPLSYVVSAHGRHVLQKNTKYERERLMPSGNESRPLAVRIALHWETVNSYLLDFAESANAPVLLFGPLGDVIPELADRIGVTVNDWSGLEKFLKEKPNRSVSHERPAGWDETLLHEITDRTWTRVQQVAQA